MGTPAASRTRQRLQISVVPGAARCGIAGWLGEALKVRVSAVPERGRANAAVEKLIADALGLDRGSVRIVAGGQSRRKTLEISGLTQAEISARLREHGA